MPFDPRQATEAYINSIGEEKLAMAQSYTTGNHWLILWGLVVSALVTWVIVRSGLPDMLASRLAKRGFALKTFVTALVLLLLSQLLGLPWSIYSEWWREVSYGHSSQPFDDYLGQFVISSTLTLLVGTLFMLGVYWVLRKTGRRWWIWASAMAVAGLAFMLLISPTVIEPLFNDYEPVPPGEVRDAIVVMADEAGIPQDRIFVFDGSRQSNNFTANVSGIGSSARIAISDVALKSASLDEVKAVTGHEIGHYVLVHVWRIVLVLSLVALAVFYLTSRTYPWFARRFGSDASIDDVRGLPVLVFTVGLYLTLSTPITNSLTRIGENEADQYSLKMVNLPDALSGALVKTAEYRNPRPGSLEEFLFYTHPSVEQRVYRAMVWKSEHPPTSPAPAPQATTKPAG